MAFPQHRATPDATAADYRRVQHRMGTSRAIVVQPAAYGTDNRVTVDAVEQLGRDDARGIGVLHPDVSDGELEALDRGGIVGLRFTQHFPATAVTTPEMIEPLANRVHELGWHTQLHLRADQVVAMAQLIDRLPGTVVFDHMGRLPQPEGTSHPAFALIRRWLAQGRTWVKLSGPYLDTPRSGPRYPEATAIAREYVKAAPDRLVWGSDWPHPTETEAKPDDRGLYDLLDEWAGDPPTLRRILVDNPAALYNFSP